MDKSFVVNGTAVLSYGTTDLAWGFCESVSVAEEGEKTEVKNGENQTVATIHSDLKTKVSAKFTPLASFGSATELTSGYLIGKTLTIPTSYGKSLSIIIDGATLETQKGDVASFSVEGYSYPGIGGSADGFGSGTVVGGQDA